MRVAESAGLRRNGPVAQIGGFRFGQIARGQEDIPQHTPQIGGGFAAFDKRFGLGPRPRQFPRVEQTVYQPLACGHSYSLLQSAFHHRHSLGGSAQPVQRVSLHALKGDIRLHRQFGQTGQGVVPGFPAQEKVEQSVAQGRGQARHGGWGELEVGE